MSAELDTLSVVAIVISAISLCASIYAVWYTRRNFLATLPYIQVGFDDSQRPIRVWAKLRANPENKWAIHSITIAGYTNRRSSISPSETRQVALDRWAPLPLAAVGRKWVVKSDKAEFFVTATTSSSTIKLEFCLALRFNWSSRARVREYLIVKKLTTSDAIDTIMAASATQDD